jgi:transcriptional regulator with XRE-family HTH domain
VDGSIPDKVQLGKAIQALREERGLTQEELALESGVSLAHVNRAENHGRNFQWETLASLVEALIAPSRFLP